MKKHLSIPMGFMLTSALLTVGVLFSAASAPISGEPSYAADGKLIKPQNYREWTAVSSGFNMAYGPLGTAMQGRPIFTNVFVPPAAYQSFMQNGTWPDKTVFVLEGRAAVAVNKSTTGEKGYFQGEELLLEIEVKDASRAAGPWSFYEMRPSQPAAAPLPAAAACYSCHATNAAADNTFVQFYPVLRDVARQKGTLKSVPEVF